MILKNKHATSPQLVQVGDMGGAEEGAGDGDNDLSLRELEGVALVLPAAGIVMRLDPRKIYLDSCTSHTQVYLQRWIRNMYETQVGLHIIRMGGEIRPLRLDGFWGPLRPG
jgi:hypothetical protein